MNTTMEIVRTIKTTGKDIPKKVKEARLKDGRSVQVLATYAGLSSAYWYKIENGQADIVSEEVIRKIEEILKIDLGINFKQPIAA